MRQKTPRHFWHVMALEQETLAPHTAPTSAMAPGAFTTYSYRLDGNTLWVTFQKNQNGPIVNPPTTKAVRVE